MAMGLRARAAVVASATMLAALAALGLGCRPHARPNVLLVTVDTLRADHLGCYGWVRDTSENLDRLAARGVRFENAMAQGSWTYSALPALLTSRYPQDHADFWLEHDGGRWGAARIAPDAPTIGEVLAREGYRGALVSGHFGLGRIAGLRRGLATADVGDYRANEVTDRGLAVLDGLRGRRFFLWLHYLDPHAPYDPPAPYVTRLVVVTRAKPRR